MIIEDIVEALEELAKQRKEKGLWSDADGTSGLLKTLEGMECFLSVQRELAQQGGDRIPLPDRKVLEEDLKGICEAVRTIGWAPAPYLDSEVKPHFGGQYEKGRTDFCDTVSFAVTTVLDFLVLRDRGQVSCAPELAKELEALVKEGVSWLVENAIIVPQTDPPQYCWSSGPKTGRQVEEFPGVYFTWSAIVALDEAVNSGFAWVGDSTEELKALVVGGHRWLASLVTGEPAEPARLKLSFPKMADIEDIDPEALPVYVLASFEAAAVHGDVDRELLRRIIGSLLRVAREARDLLTTGSHMATFFRGRTRTTTAFEDRTLSYLLFEGLCWSWKYLRETGGKEDLLWLEDQVKPVIRNLRDGILNSRAPSGAWNAGAFFIYYNQRAIEALTYYLLHVGEDVGEFMVLEWSDDLRRSIERIVGEVFAASRSELLKRIDREVSLYARRMKPPAIRSMRPDEFERLEQQTADAQERLKKSNLGGRTRRGAGE